ncbi:hypothetical protein HS088_TW15G00520 [Tripterygium wilfordii]|uniref:Uncharacterized protein n=1 Tax=Tripterygium wilfordii TaxID=458696 RepID=A0A7J7CLX1_TRIWF|nr:hypothetical protein HS088_TW15G00520 [Tripterygium wilfordii]
MGGEQLGLSTQRRFHIAETSSINNSNIVVVRDILDGFLNQVPGVCVNFFTSGTNDLFVLVRKFQLLSLNCFGHLVACQPLNKFFFFFLNCILQCLSSLVQNIWLYLPACLSMHCLDMLYSYREK